MANRNIIIKPILTEKSTTMADDPALNVYTFQVDKGVNKIQIKEAVEQQFGVTVLSVNTSIRPGKTKNRVVKGRYVSGRTSPVKKAYVKVAEGEFIDGFYGAEDDFDEVELIEDDELEA